MFVGVAFVLFVATTTWASPAGEYAKHFAALEQLSVAVAQAMPADQYTFKPHPESMSFGELMLHIAITNYGFCAGLKECGRSGCGDARTLGDR